jgi:hypothetical protein
MAHIDPRDLENERFMIWRHLDKSWNRLSRVEEMCYYSNAHTMLDLQSTMLPSNKRLCNVSNKAPRKGMIAATRTICIPTKY